MGKNLQRLTTDYEGLLKRYSMEKNFIQKRNSTGVTTFPVIQDAWLFNKNIKIVDYPENEYRLPGIVVNNFNELFKSFSSAKIYNSINIRVDDWYMSDDSNTFTITTGRTNYYKSLVTNRAIDYTLAEGISVRELLECGPFIHSLKTSSLSNHLGFNGFVESADGKIALIFRKKGMSIGEETYSNSVTASLKIKYALNESYLFTKDGLMNAIIEENNDELGIPFKTLITENDEPITENDEPIQLIAAYRDVLDGGKPQLLFYAKTEMTSEQITYAFNSKNTKINCNEKPLAATESMITDGNFIYWMALEDLLKCDVFPNKFVHDGKDFTMLPSAAACIVMLQEFKNKR